MDDLTPAKVEVIVTIAEDSMSNLQHISSELQNCGLEITAQPIERLGMISGKAGEQHLDQLRNIMGVLAVEKAGSMQILPPESYLQ